MFEVLSPKQQANLVGDRFALLWPDKQYYICAWQKCLLAIWATLWMPAGNGKDQLQLSGIFVFLCCLSGTCFFSSFTYTCHNQCIWLRQQNFGPKDECIYSRFIWDNSYRRILKRNFVVVKTPCGDIIGWTLGRVLWHLFNMIWCLLMN